MKKLFLLFATVTLLVGFQACKQKAAEDTTATTDSTAAAVTVTDSAMVTVPAAVGDSKNLVPPTNPPK